MGVNDPLGIFIIMHNLATLLIGGALGLSWHPRLAGLRGGAVPSMSSRWLDDFMEDEVLRDARWSAAGLPPGVSEDGALTYGEFSAERFHDLLGKAVALCGGDASNLTFIDIGSGAGRLVLSAAAGFPFRRCTGVEVVEPLHEMALQMHDAAEQLARQLDCRLAPCSFECVDMMSAEARPILKDASIAFAFSTCFPDEIFAACLRSQLSVGALVITIDAVLPNADTASDSGYFHLVGVESVEGHMHYLWHLKEGRPQLSIDYSVFKIPRSMVGEELSDGIEDEENEKDANVGGAEEEEEEDLGADGELASRIRQQMADQVALPDSRFLVADTNGRGKGL